MNSLHLQQSHSFASNVQNFRQQSNKRKPNQNTIGSLIQSSVKAHFFPLNISLQICVNKFSSLGNNENTQKRKRKKEKENKICGQLCCQQQINVREYMCVLYVFF